MCWRCMVVPTSNHRFVHWRKVCRSLWQHQDDSSIWWSVAWQNSTKWKTWCSTKQTKCFRWASPKALIRFWSKYLRSATRCCSQPRWVRILSALPRGICTTTRRLWWVVVMRVLRMWTISIIWWMRKTNTMRWSDWLTTIQRFTPSSSAALDSKHRR